MKMTKIIAGIFNLNENSENNMKKVSHNAKVEFAYRLFWLFVVGSIAGFFVETAWCFAKYGHIENRSSLVVGPFNLVYGLGALAMHLSISLIKNKNNFSIFLVGVVTGTAVEYFCSLFQEKVFGTVSWNYSSTALNIGGRVCLIYSIYWGILAVAWVHIIYPCFDRLINKMPHLFGKKTAKYLFVFIVVAALLSGAAVSRWMSRANNVPANDAVEEVLDRVFPDSSMEAIYPNMVTVNK